MMLPDRHIYLDAQRLQALFDAEQDRARFARLRASLRDLRRDAGMPVIGGALLLPAMLAIVALLAAALRGAA